MDTAVILVIAISVLFLIGMIALVRQVQGHEMKIETMERILFVALELIGQTAEANKDITKEIKKAAQDLVSTPDEDDA